MLDKVFAASDNMNSTRHETTSTQSPDESQPRTRNRVSRACLPCHSAKRKCNKARPCSQCLKRQITSNCIYESVTDADLEALEAADPGLLSENQVLRSRVGELETAIAALRAQLRQPRNGQGRSRKRRRGSDASVDSQNDRDGKYYGRSIYLGGPAAPDLLQRMMPLLAPADQPDLLLAFSGGSLDTNPSASPGGFPFPTIFPASHTAKEMLYLLREIGRERSDALVDSFFELIDPIYHYVPSGWFYQRYNKSWDAVTALADPLADSIGLIEVPLAQELALVYVVLGLGDLVSERTMANVLIPASMQLLRISNFLASPSLDTLHTLCFFAVYLQHQGKLSEHWPLLGLVIRLAQSMALHRDPSLINLPPQEGEVRRRLFWTIAAQDTALSLMFGRPHALGFYDCNLPLDISDERALDDQANDTDSNEPGKNEISYNRYTWELGEITREMVQRSFTTQDAEGLQKTQYFQDKLRRWYSGLPNHFKVDLSQNQAATSFNSLTKRYYVQSLLLHMIYNYNILVLFRKSLLDNASTEHGRPCFEAAFEIIASWKVLHDDFPKMAKMAWMHCFRAFHASLICLLVFKSDKWRPEYDSRALHSWLSARRIFERLKNENESLLTCWRALKRLDMVLKLSGSHQNSRQIRKPRASFSDSSQKLLIPPITEQGQHTSTSNPLAQPPAQTLTNSAHTSPANEPLSSSWDGKGPLDPNLFGAPSQMGPGTSASGGSGSSNNQLLESPTSLLYSSNAGLEYPIDMSSGVLDTVFGQQDNNIFNMDFQNWPSWLTDDQSPNFPV